MKVSMRGITKESGSGTGLKLVQYDQNRNTTEFGIQRQLAALEKIANPSSAIVGSL